MNKTDFFLLGKLTKCNRKSGELTLQPDTDDPDMYETGDILFLDIDGGLVPFFIATIKRKTYNTIFVRFDGYEHPAKAEKLVGNLVYLPLSLLKSLADDQFYYHDIIGYAVQDKYHGRIGTVEQVLERQHQDILQIVLEGREILVPIADEIFININRSEKIIYIDAPEGLIDLYLGNEPA
nr:16S rRNA processing protein RimM [Bacteroidota bacterium]